MKFEIKPVSGALGAEILGVKLDKNLSNSQFDTIHKALLDYQVIFFRDQNLAPEEHISFARRFGELDYHPFAASLEEFPEIIAVIKEANDKTNRVFGGGWHTDVTFYEKPAMGSILYALEVPPFGGDTLFSNMYMAYEALSDGFKNLLHNMSAVHSASKAYGPNGRAAKRNSHATSGGYDTIKVRTGLDALEETKHPVVRTHPETGKKGIFVNQGFTIKFNGWTEEESAPLLNFLYQHSARPEFTCRFRWKTGSVAFWDNRCTHHFALNDYQGYRRAMHRVTICGDKPH